jgi:protein-S-isoprenylcysteine O-methyltransferase Ste14
MVVRGGRLIMSLSAVVVLVIELAHGFHRRQEAVSRDRGSRVMFAVAVPGGIFVAAIAPRVAPGADIGASVAAFVIGEAMVLCGAGLRLWAIRSLGHYFTRTVMVSSDQRVVTTGPYAFVRHPSYTALLMYMVGFGILLGNWLGVLGLTGAMLVALVYRIRVEEEALSAALGEAYTRYAAQHKRLVPLIW